MGMGKGHVSSRTVSERLHVNVGELHVFDTQNYDGVDDNSNLAYMILLSKGTEYEPAEWLWGEDIYHMFDEFDMVDGLEALELNYTYEFSRANAPVHHYDFFYYLGPAGHNNVTKYIESE